MQNNLQIESEEKARQQHQPRARIEGLKSRVGGERLTAGKEAVPQRELPAVYDAAHYEPRRKVIANHVADVEAAAEEKDVGEEERGGQNQECRDLCITAKQPHASYGSATDNLFLVSQLRQHEGVVERQILERVVASGRAAMSGAH